MDRHTDVIYTKNAMNLRNVTIWTPVLFLIAYYWLFFFHAVYNGRETDVTWIFLSGAFFIGAPAFVLIIGWPLIAIFVITIFVRNRVSCIVLLLLAAVYGVLWLNALTQWFTDPTPQPVAGLALLLLPIYLSFYMVPFWLLAIGLEIYFRMTHPGTTASPLSPALLQGKNEVQ